MGGNLFEPIDIYCERVGPGLWAEPVNALTNLSFLAAAAFVLALLPRLRGRAQSTRASG